MCYDDLNTEIFAGGVSVAKKKTAAVFAVLAAALYAINIPFSKLFLTQIAPCAMAGLLYFGAGTGMMLWSGIRRAAGKGDQRERLTRKELPYTIAMVVLDIAAPILLMCGISRTNSANASLLNNFEIVATAVIALVVFKEAISPRLWCAIGIVTAASVILTFESIEGFSFHLGSLLVLGACVCWGFENNCTKMLSQKSSEEIVIIKGIFSGLGSFAVSLFLREPFPAVPQCLAVMALGFVAYGLSINFYIMAQNELGAAKTSAYYSIAPFLGVAFSMLLLQERPAPQFYLALGLMAAATVLMTQDTIRLQHSHEHTHVHCHPHRHGMVVHTHEHSHTHSHLHTHGADLHTHVHCHRNLEPHNHDHSYM